MVICFLILSPPIMVVPFLPMVILFFFRWFFSVNSGSFFFTDGFTDVFFDQRFFFFTNGFSFSTNPMFVRSMVVFFLQLSFFLPPIFYVSFFFTNSVFLPILLYQRCCSFPQWLFLIVRWYFECAPFYQ